MSIQAKKRTPINRSLLDTLGTIFARMPESDFNKLIENRDAFIKKYDEIRVTEEFYRAVSRNPWVKESVDYRFSIIEKLIEESIR